MKKFEGVLLACDFDNTIAPTGKCMAQGIPFSGVPEENIRAIRYFMEEGGLFSVVTGRAYPAYLHLKDLIPVNCPTALFNGAGIYDFGKEEYLWKVDLPDSIAEHYHEVMEAFPTLGMEIFCWDKRVYAERPNVYVDRHQLLTKAPFVEVDRLESVEGAVAKLLFEDEYEVLVEVQKFLLSRPWIKDYETIFSGKHLLELTARGATKAGAVRELARIFGVKDEDLYCAGDEENDLSMLELAETAFVPEDCNPLLKDRPFCFVGPCTRHAIADIIAILDEKYTQR